MKPIVVSDVLAVGEVPSPEQMEILAKAGFKSIINSQPDGEVDRLPGNVVLAADAKRVGLAYAYAPMANRTPSSTELNVFAEALKKLPAPIYGFCYSGARSAAACAMLLTETMEPDAIIAQFAAADFDVSGLKPWLEDERKRRAPAQAKTNGGSQANGNGKTTMVAAPAPTPVAARPPVAVPPPAVTAPKAVEGIVVHARAMGQGGFAM